MTAAELIALGVDLRVAQCSWCDRYFRSTPEGADFSQAIEPPADVEEALLSHTCCPDCLATLKLGLERQRAAA